MRIKATARSTIKGLRSMESTSSSIPMDTKKRILNISLRGRISLNAWCPYSDSEITRPARKAPSASDKPTSDVNQAVPKQMSTILIKNNSRLWVETTWYNIFGIMNRDTAIIRTTIERAQKTFNATSKAEKPDLPPNMGRNNTTATTLRS